MLFRARPFALVVSGDVRMCFPLLLLGFLMCTWLIIMRTFNLAIPHPFRHTTPFELSEEMC